MIRELLKEQITILSRIVSRQFDTDGEKCVMLVSPVREGLVRIRDYQAIPNNVRTVLGKDVEIAESVDKTFYIVRCTPKQSFLLTDRIGKNYACILDGSHIVQERQEFSPKKPQQKKWKRVTSCTYHSYHR